MYNYICLFEPLKRYLFDSSTQSCSRFNIGCISNGLDYNGGDIWKDRSSTAEDCGKQCKENADCGKWTFVVPGNNGTCVLKRNSSDFIIPCLECISGFRSTETTRCERHG